MPVLVIVLIESCNLFVMFAVSVGSIQQKSRFTVAESESRNSAVAEGGILVSDKNSVKR